MDDDVLFTTVDAEMTDQETDALATAADFATPMMQQYQDIKAQYPDCLLFFRLGDFYEMFLDDAKIGAEVLDITLTARSRGRDGKIPMAGVPYHAVDGYIAKLTKAGYKVALCDQVTEPDGKGLVERQVVRIITPGTTHQSQALDAKTSNFVLCLDLTLAASATSEVITAISAAACDVTTGQIVLHHQDFAATTVTAPTTVTRSQNNPSATPQSLLAELNSRLHPAELVISSDGENNALVQSLLATHFHCPVTIYTSWPSTEREARERFTTTWSRPKELAALTRFSIPTQCTLAALLSYLEYTQQQTLSHLKLPQPLFASHILLLDPSTVRNLELVTSLHDGTTHGTLLEVIDYTKTAMGGRLLKQWIIQPLTHLPTINERQLRVHWLTQHPREAQTWQSRLRSIVDTERLVARLHLGVGTPRDLKSLEQSMVQAAALQADITETQGPFAELTTHLSSSPLKKLVALIHETIIDEPPADPKGGGFVKPGVQAQIDAHQTIITSHRQKLLALEAQLRQETSISSLKIKFNKVFGFYIEVTNSNLHLVPDTFERKQTLVNAERFITKDMKVWESEILHSQDAIKEEEWQVFQRLLNQVKQVTPTLQIMAENLAELDCLLSLAQAANIHQYAAPTFTSGSQLQIIEGRHPVVEQVIGRHHFIPNAVSLDTDHHQVMLITGPNMAGKSVLMRQVALIVLLAHMGSFVPAREVKLGIVDTIFVRSGAADAIAQGLSTFMVEMVETAHILHHATSQSLIIMDEIGRGTSTYDGISLAWAIAEFLVNNEQRRPKTLFATHYHELQALADEYPDRIHNFSMAVDNTTDQPLFLYSLRPGASEHSFGVAVATIAGIPSVVTDRARKLLHDLETQRQPQVGELSQSTSLAYLTQLDLNQITPLDALNLLVKLKTELSATNTNSNNDTNSSSSTSRHRPHRRRRGH